MQDVRRDFNVRVSELIACVRHVETLKTSGANPTVYKALKASCYVQAYNLVESTATQLVIAIFDHLYRNAVSFDDVKPELKIFVVTQAKKHEPKKLAVKLSTVARDLFGHSVDAERLFSGNVDARRLRDLAEQLGYGARGSGDGGDLLKIKTVRNDLAHGTKSFVEVGREVDIEEVKTHIASTFWYLRGTLGSAEQYLHDETYLQT